MDIIIIALVVFCLLSGALIGFLAHSFPRLLLALSELSACSRQNANTLNQIHSSALNSNYVLKELLRLQQEADKAFAGALAPGIYQEGPEGNLVALTKEGHNRTTLPGGLVAPPGFTPSQIHR